tara:strand:- start:246 stop:509 length:264 start_codon:yes stop_codon:yes gene_type:complete
MKTTTKTRTNVSMQNMKKLAALIKQLTAPKKSVTKNNVNKKCAKSVPNKKTYKKPTTRRVKSVSPRKKSVRKTKRKPTPPSNFFGLF